MDVDRIFGPEVGLAHRAGGLHVHTSGSAKGYWASWDCGSLVNDVSHDFDDLTADISTFLREIGKEWSGFQRITGLDAFITEKNVSLVEREGVIDKFVSELGSSGAEQIFLDFSSGEDTSVVSRSLFEAILKLEGASRVTPIIPLDKFDWGNEENRVVFEAAALHAPLFLNGGNQIDSTDEVSNPWLEGSVRGISTGVLGAITLNLPHAAREARDEDSFLERVYELMDLACGGLENKRLHLEQKLELGMMPLTKKVAGSLNGYFGAISVVGVNEALLSLLGRGIETMQGKAVAYKLLEHMKARIREYGEETGHPFCLEAVPSDGAPYRLAEIDKCVYPDIVTSGVDAPFYTGSTSLPAGYTDDLWDALEHQKKLQTLYDGATIFNIDLEKTIEDAEGCMKLTRRIAERFMMPCFAFSPPTRICREHGLQHTMGGKCQTCGLDTEEYVRLELGYRPISSLERGELEEVRIRRHYAVVSGW